jgi:DNA-binding GntR family transcriptional regulator
METRVLVECFAIAKVLARGAVPALADGLADAIARQRRLAAAGDTEGFVAVDREFHTLLVTAAGNPIVTGLYDTLRDRQQRMVSTSLMRDEWRVASILVEHETIADALRDGDAERADSVLRRHLQATLELLRGE